MHVHPYKHTPTRLCEFSDYETQFTNNKDWKQQLLVLHFKYIMGGYSFYTAISNLVFMPPPLPEIHY